MKLPMHFFDTKLVGDLLQRMNDHERVESFLTAQSLNVLFLVFNLLIFSVLLSQYEESGSTVINQGKKHPHYRACSHSSHPW